MPAEYEVTLMGTEIRDTLERYTDETERLYQQIRDSVRLLPVLETIPKRERQEMEETVFSVPMPED